MTTDVKKTPVCETVVWLLTSGCKMSLKKKTWSDRPWCGHWGYSIPYGHWWVNNKIFRTSFVIKKVLLIFVARCLLSLKNRQMCPKNSFALFSRKILLFSKRLLNKKIPHLVSDKKGCIHFWCKMTPYRSHSDPAIVSQTK